MLSTPQKSDSSSSTILPSLSRHVHSLLILHSRLHSLFFADGSFGFCFAECSLDTSRILMAFLALRSPLSVHCSPIWAISRPSNGRNRRCFSISMNASKSGVAIVWFKQDLRVEDHPGLVAAAQYRAIVPIYVFDQRILSREFHFGF